MSTINHLTIAQQEAYIIRVSRFFRSLKPSAQREIQEVILKNPKLQQQFNHLLRK